MTGKDQRGERLASALRDNLRRRKAQARAQAAEGPPPAPRNDAHDGAHDDGAIR